MFGPRASEDTLILLQRIVSLEDAIAQHRHNETSLKARLTELENLVGKVSHGATGNQWFTIPDQPSLVADENKT